MSIYTHTIHTHTQHTRSWGTERAESRLCSCMAFLICLYSCVDRPKCIYFMGVHLSPNCIASVQQKHGAYAIFRKSSRDAGLGLGRTPDSFIRTLSSSHW